MTLRDGLLTAARFLLEDGSSIDGAEAVRIGIRLAELAGMTSVIESGGGNEKEQGTKP